MLQVRTLAHSKPRQQHSQQQCDQHYGRNAPLLTARRPCCITGSLPQSTQSRQHIIRAAKEPGRAGPDLIESLVGKLFGQKALSDPSPMGMKRIDFDSMPDQKVELEKQAAVLPCDDGEIALLRPLLSRTQLELRPLRLAYDAERDGWGARQFHDRVGGFGAAVLVAQTVGGALIGGYNPEGWIGLGEDRASNGAFLFTWRSGDTTQRAVKLPKIGGPNLAVMDNPSTGPAFGAEGLSIPLRPRGQERIARSRLGTYYARMPDNSRTLFSPQEDAKKTELTELRVYVGEGGGVTWELDGIVWKTSTAA